MISTEEKIQKLKENKLNILYQIRKVTSYEHIIKPTANNLQELVNELKTTEILIDYLKEEVK
jgi:hypothetical protein